LILILEKFGFVFAEALTEIERRMAKAAVNKEA
jgi:hypothetical protein